MLQHLLTENHCERLRALRDRESQGVDFELAGQAWPLRRAGGTGAVDAREKQQPRQCRVRSGLPHEGERRVPGAHPRGWTPTYPGSPVEGGKIEAKNASHTGLTTLTGVLHTIFIPNHCNGALNTISPAFNRAFL